MAEFRGVLVEVVEDILPGTERTIFALPWVASTTVPTPDVVGFQELTVPAWSVSTTVPDPDLTPGEVTLTAPPWTPSTSVPDLADVLPGEVTLVAPPWSTSTTVPTPDADPQEVTLVAPPWTPSTAVPDLADVLPGEVTLVAPPWSVSTTVFTPAVAGEMLVPPWTPTTVVPVPHIAADIVAPPWSPTTSVPVPTISAEYGLVAPPWSISTEVETPYVWPEMIAPPWNPTTTVPIPAVDGNVTAPPWNPTTTVPVPIISTEVTLVAPPWNPSTTVPVPTIRLEEFVVAPPWNPTTTVPVPTVSGGLVAPPWNPTTTVPGPTVILAGPLIAPPWNPTTTVPIPTIARFVDLRLTPPRGRNTGGEHVDFVGTLLDMSNCMPTLTDGVFDSSLWTDISSGTGVVQEIGASRSLRLSTGVTAGSTAGVRDINQAADVDIEVEGRGVFDLALYADASNELRLSCTPGVITLSGTVGGATVIDQPIAITGGSPKLRMLRTWSDVRIFLGGQELLVAAWTDALCRVEVSVQNDATADGEVSALITSYKRRPVVIFDRNPVVDLELVSMTRARATTPARDLPGVIDVLITGCTTIQDVIPNGFEYYLDPRFASVRTSVAVSDLTVSGQTGRSI